MIACFFSNISAKYYKNPSMLSRVIAKNVGDVFFETQCISKTENIRSLAAKTTVLAIRCKFLNKSLYKETRIPSHIWQSVGTASV